MRAFVFGVALLSSAAAFAGTKPKHADPAPAAGPHCWTTAEAFGTLKQKYHETPIWAGAIKNGPIVEMVTQSEDGRSWTLLTVDPVKHVACLVEFGSAGSLAPAAEQTPAAPAAPEAPAAPPASEDDGRIHGSTDGKRQI